MVGAQAKYDKRDAIMVTSHAKARDVVISQAKSHGFLLLSRIGDLSG